jgi:cytochrome b6-f complex iron-sulfur subunit
MADDKKKLSTQDILAMARAQTKGGAGKEEPDSTAEAPEASSKAPEAKPETPAEGGDSSPPAPSGAPKTTEEILAAARAQKKQGSAPASSGSAAPKSTADILAAARAQSGAKSAADSSGSAAPAKPSQPAAKPIAEGDLPPVEEMVKAVTGTKLAEPAKPPKKPVIPVRPAPKPAAQAEVPRRSVLLGLVATPFALAWTLLALVGGGFTLYLARFMMPNVLVEPPSRFKIGPPTDYGLGTVSTKWKSQFGVWIVHTEYRGQKQIYALASVCTHLGCTPNWLEGEQKFKCPCHGSGFYINGINFEGPAPRPLERVGIALGSDGMLEVDKSVKFQEELGQWSDDTSYVVV